MYNIDIYNTKINNKNMIYSIDNIRLKTYISYQEFKNIESFFNIYYSKNIKRFWLSDKKNSFHYNYNIEIEKGKSFIFQFMHNTESINYNKIEKEYNFTIEFNPNKLRNNNLVFYILNSFSRWYLRSFDIAIDLPINILDILFDRKTKKSYKIFSSGGDNLTYYIGTKEKDGSIKIYNKKVESNLSIVGYLTRIEISRQYDDFDLIQIKNFDFGNKFIPELYINQYAFSFSDVTTKDKTTIALLYAVQSGYPLNELSRDFRKKIKSMLDGGYKIDINKDIINKVLLECIYYYFNTRESKQIFL